MLTARARIKGDIENMFPDAKVPRELVAKVVADQVMGLGYSNFKNTVKQNKCREAYMDVWSAMYAVQER